MSAATNAAKFTLNQPPGLCQEYHSLQKYLPFIPPSACYHTLFLVPCQCQFYTVNGTSWRTL